MHQDGTFTTCCTKTRCDTLVGTHCNTLQHAATCCNTLQHTATHCNRVCHYHATWITVAALPRTAPWLNLHDSRKSWAMCSKYKCPFDLNSALYTVLFSVLFFVLFQSFAVPWLHWFYSRKSWAMYSKYKCPFDSNSSHRTVVFSVLLLIHRNISQRCHATVSTQIVSHVYVVFPYLHM